MRFALKIPQSVALFAVAVAAGAELPEGPGKAETGKLCATCHDMARAVSVRQDRDGWKATMSKMVALGMKGSESQFEVVIDYLAKHFGAEQVPRINVNKATAIQLESGLTLRRSQAAAILKYRAAHGDFKSLEDLKKVPGLDVEKIESKKDRLTF